MAPAQGDTGRLPLTVFLLLLVGLLSCAAPPRAAAEVDRPPPGRPLMGIFASCPPSEMACFSRLGVARGMGFELLLNMGGLASGPEAARQYALDAEALGMNIAWPLSDESWWLHFDPAGTNLLYAHQAWADACGCTDNQDLVEYVVSTLASFPNTWGWYAADDLSIRSPDRVDDLTAWTQRLKQLAPGTSTVIAVWDNLATYRDAADYVAQESYPFGLPRGL